MDISVVIKCALVVLLVYAVLEFIYITLIKKADFRYEYSQPLKALSVSIFFSVMFSRVFPFIAVSGASLAGESLSLFSFGRDWYVLIIALIIYEFWYWTQHYLAHKVRFLWCMHSAHHAPNTLNIVVGSNHHVLESFFYFPFFLGFLPALCGIPSELVIICNLLDAAWGSFIHISPKVFRDEISLKWRLFQSPSLHRAHHAKNLCYMDMNFNSVTTLWDRVFKTYVQLDEPVEFGITRLVNTESYIDVHFGEFIALYSDIKSTSSYRLKALYCLMPPGWSHKGSHQTVSNLRRRI